MALEEGNEKDLNKGLPQNVSPEIQELLLEMRRKIAVLEESKQSAPQSIAGQTSPEQFAMLVAEIAKAVKTRPEAESLTVSKFVEERDIDPKDYDREGVRFSAFGTGWYIVDDLRNGFPVSTPFKNMLVFAYTGTKRGNRDERGKEELSTFCTFVSHSKMEQKWLREHRHYGVKFFESATAALSVNAERSQAFARCVDSLAAQDQNQVMAQCQSYGVPISTNMRDMRLALAEKMVEKMFEARKASTEKMLTESFEEREFSNSTKTTSEVLGRKI